MARVEDLRVRQLDEKLGDLKPLRNRRPPPSGWAKAIREALGISVRQMAKRTGLSRTSITSAEKGEAKGTVQLATLEGLADALDCELVYALVPRGSLAETIRQQAYRKASGMLGRVDDSMRLERQGVERDELARQIEELAGELLQNRGRDFWDV